MCSYFYQWTTNLEKQLNKSQRVFYIPTVDLPNFDHPWTFWTHFFYIKIIQLDIHIPSYCNRSFTTFTFYYFIIEWFTDDIDTVFIGLDYYLVNNETHRQLRQINVILQQEVFRKCKHWKSSPFIAKQKEMHVIIFTISFFLSKVHKKLDYNYNKNL